MLLTYAILLATGALALPTDLIPTPTPSPVSPRQATVLPITSSPTPTPTPTINFLTTEHITIDGLTNAHVTNPGKTIDLVLPTCVQTITPDANGYVPPGTCGALWSYYPSFMAAVAFAAVFGVLTAVHIWQAVRYKKRWCWVIIMASIWETLAFTFRAISAKQQQSVGIYLVFQIFILLAPLWVNAFAYVTLGRMIHFFIPSHSLLHVPAATFAAIFVALDFISFIVQLVGGSMAGPTSSAADQLKSIHIYMGGIGMQEVFIVIFVCLAAKFQLEATRSGTQHAVGPTRLLGALYASLTLITIRIIYRLVEFSSGSVDNSLTEQEAYFYVLEATPMVFAIAVYNLVHPGAVIPDGPGSEMPGVWATLKKGICMCTKRRGGTDGKSNNMLLQDEAEVKKRRTVNYEML